MDAGVSSSSFVSCRLMGLANYVNNYVKPWVDSLSCSSIRPSLGTEFMKTKISLKFSKVGVRIHTNSSFQI